LSWQDWDDGLEHRDNMHVELSHMYRREARDILRGGGILFPVEPVKPGDARLLVHPPGYAISMAACTRLFGTSTDSLRALQVIGDGISATMIFFIAAALLPRGLAISSGLLVALSPHFSYYSLYLSPDTLAVLPIIIAVFLLVLAARKPRLRLMISAGVMVGVSCWLRSNALLLAPFLALAFSLACTRGKRLTHFAAIVGATLLTVMPITIRNVLVFHRFVPVSLPMGLGLVEGIADYDFGHRFGMPQVDPEAGFLEAKWTGHEEYAGSSPWVPDGFDREQIRLSRGLAIIRSNPVWFGGVMLRRAGFMLRYNESKEETWPFYTGTAPIITGASTPHKWARYPRMLFRIQQRTLFSTWRMLPLVFIGLMSLIRARRWNALAMLLAVPLYYLTAHSAFNTEYRYVLGIHYFLFVLAATGLYCTAKLFWWHISRSVKVLSQTASQGDRGRELGYLKPGEFNSELPVKMQ
jgi:4-amino-4-deoxy-L-arabinose transferase-like glycosyltransferase